VPSRAHALFYFASSGFCIAAMGAVAGYYYFWRERPMKVVAPIVLGGFTCAVPLAAVGVALFFRRGRKLRAQQKYDAMLLRAAPDTMVIG
jgi:hypothetical protein